MTKPQGGTAGVEDVTRVLRELEALGVKRKEYDLRSPWDRTGHRLTDAPPWGEAPFWITLRR